mmetsp:Transcript_135861/g.253857  ORF Transcript_135861/g.253857 Transcript_135861/m.253857 type:complete len:391 (-) Transcript_135861:131-1303(-)
MVADMSVGTMASEGAVKGTTARRDFEIASKLKTAIPAGPVASKEAWRQPADEWKTEARKIRESLTFFPGFYGEAQCLQIESLVDSTARRAAAGQFIGQHTVDSTPRRTKYFFGNGYTYGYGRRGSEELLPVGAVDAIPTWIHDLVIQPLVDYGIVEDGWIDSVVMNDYRVGGCIVAHVDPPQLFARPILSSSFFCPAQLVFGASFDPERKTPPVYTQPLTRGSVLSMDGYSANEVTHGMRPEDMFGTRRVSIVLRHVLKKAPMIVHQVPIDMEERSRLIREVQGRWHDPTGRIFYDVSQLTVRVSEVIEDQKEDNEEGAKPDKTQRKKKATWRLVPKEHGILCNGGMLLSSGVTEEELQWRTSTKRNSADAEDVMWTWIRVRGDEDAVNN